MQNNFCKALSNAVSFRIPGDSNSITFNPCCLYNDYLPFHPSFFNKVRKTFIESDQDYLPGCSKCELKEKTHGLKKTQRGFFNEQIPDGIGSDIYKLEIVLDTTCNAACIQCGPNQSSLWRNEFAQRDPNYVQLQPKDQIDSKIEIIKKSIDIQKVKDWHFWGGEPLLTDTHMKLINQIEDLSTVKLAYTTNGSIFPKNNVLELWSKCKEVRIGISTDGIEDKFNHCRWPLKWDKWERNTKRFKNETPSNIIFHINYCAMPQNSLYTDEIENWKKSNFDRNLDGSDISFGVIRCEGIIDLACTPISLREEIWKKLGDDHVISKILCELPIIDYKVMVENIEYWDKIRNLDWRKIFPEASRHFVQ